MGFGMNSLGIGEIGEEADKVVNTFTVFENDILEILFACGKESCLNFLCAEMTRKLISAENKVAYNLFKAGGLVCRVGSRKIILFKNIGYVPGVGIAIVDL